ncbi:MAG: 30S ribosomal protein S4 [Candidatus Methanoperedens nitroreducens]|uniref:Small ribosomal subunit protein eS4 n=1 Tax=Candidatus Methanoperedens nitratireducens TaxID=1392998 RepID=A0A0P8C843_9EURY|nr:30S ribosomal protein S4e [Candidatus Methanoperedens sp. BLZ2]KAB2945672.1 MAG: 30S ribosomal protein S4e [Candidatus Methanoperedens sp.]KPQ42975.1 MAG: 30S ribosomal protein S4 [Candidatus Methanoperedens sp. BLZ1]MBZ0177299.1 30S ribosomal protein S4e [Candidatus Methanoperedens nitroreducens]MCX9076823.1 30S ribosomal protein S4e [Candidatus Methanoperedens sp.]
MATHQKRVAAPISWPITRKTYHWVVGANPGAHSTETGIPLLVVVRDILKIANNAREAKRIINEKNICIDGVIRTDYKYMIGLFDIISLPATNEYYRVLFDSKNRFKLFKEDANAGKLCRINNKTIVRKGAVQLNLHDGTNVLASNDYKTFDTVILDTDRKIMKHIGYKTGNLAMIVGGEHSGEIGKIKQIRKVRGSGTNMVAISNETEFETIEDYVYVIGETTPQIKVV